MSNAYVVNYDDHHYDYKSYWNGRNYENIVEQHVIQSLIQNENINTLLDVGGSFGRALPTYYPSSKLPIILDYSLETLQNNYDTIKNKYPNTELIAGNAYYLPFKDNSIDGAIMIRTLHHIEKPEQYIKEISRVLKNNSLYIQEFANKLHIKAILKNILRLNFKFFDLSPYQQPSRGNLEGAVKGDAYVFLNFHHQHIKDILQQNNFNINKVVGTSFLRVPQLKKVIPAQKLAKLDFFLEKIPAIQTLAPSIYIKSHLKKPHSSKQSTAKLSDIICCPKCHKDLKQISASSLKCYTCNTTFRKKGNIWDLRYNG